MKNKSVYNWSRELASKDGKYGGGSAASVVGAIAVNLAQYVFELQQGKEQYAEHEEELAEAVQKAERINDELLDLAEEDAEAFDPVLDLYKLPKDTEEERNYRRQKIDEGLEEAARPPFAVMKRMDDVVSLFEELLRLEVEGSINEDIVVGLILAQATIDSQLRNSFTNIDAIKDDERRERLAQDVNETYEAISARITPLKRAAIAAADGDAKEM